MEHHTKNKGDIGLTKVISDLVEKGFNVSLPIHEHLPYDLIVDMNGKLSRVQIKFRNNINFKCSTSHVNTKGEIVTQSYNKSDFELYAIYSNNLKLCYYVPNVGQNTITISEKEPQTFTSVYWYEDFLNPTITDMPNKRSPKSFSNFNPPALKNLKNGNLKVTNRPSYDTLLKEIKELGFKGTGRKYGVSDNAVRKWKNKYELNNTNMPM